MSDILSARHALVIPGEREPACEVCRKQVKGYGTMAYEEVTIKLDPPRTFSFTGMSILFREAGLPDIKLPCSVITYSAHDTPEGKVATSITLPRGIAEREGLVEPLVEANDTQDSFYELVFAAAIAGFCSGAQVVHVNNSRGEVSAIVDAARKIADKAVER